ncbi:MAG: aminotransferase class I/II-fold pyridoxal phosphate-dependent enzyme [Bacteroidota bacterium]
MTTLGSAKGKSLTVRDVLVRGRRLPLHERAALFSTWLAGAKQESMGGVGSRIVCSPIDREVLVADRTGATQPMLMFGSNSYLGLTNHPYVRERVHDAIRQFGVGVGGPPLLNGYSLLHRELEERLAEFEGCEDCVLYGSGYSANVGVMSALPTPQDHIVYDALSHASFIDGVRLGGTSMTSFPHNDLDELDALLAAMHEQPGDRYVGIEGIYSMDGDFAPLADIIDTCQRHGAISILDDAHGTGVAAPGGRGTATRFGVEGRVDVIVGTFSKAFGVSGGFAATTKPIADYLRLASRAYVFSASLPPTTVAAVLAGLDLLDQEPELQTRLIDNAAYLAQGLRALGFEASGNTGILPLPVPVGMDLRAAARAFHERGLFLNHIEYPAVKVSQQRFRISLMASHTTSDLDRLLTAIEEVWAEFAPKGVKPGDAVLEPLAES